eukprot:IDg9967t1
MDAHAMPIGHRADGTYSRLCLAGPALLMAIMHVWGRNAGELNVKLYGVISIPAKYIALAMCAISTVLNGKLDTSDIAGILAGQLYYFFDSVFPGLPQGRRVIFVPLWFERGIDYIGDVGNRALGIGSTNRQMSGGSRPTSNGNGSVSTAPSGSSFGARSTGVTQPAARPARHVWGSGRTLEVLDLEPTRVCVPLVALRSPYITAASNLMCAAQLLARAVRALPAGGGRTIHVALSGGVDSSVTALLLRDAGWSVRPVLMRCWAEDGGGCFEKDSRAAEAATRALDLPHPLAVFDLTHVACNARVKFGAFPARLRAEAGVTNTPLFATGHYARTSGGVLRTAADAQKDQTYFLAGVAGVDLQAAMFPLGTLRKTDTRAIAAHAVLPAASARSSRGICFVGKRAIA